MVVVAVVVVGGAGGQKSKFFRGAGFPCGLSGKICCRPLALADTPPLLRPLAFKHLPHPLDMLAFAKASFKSNALSFLRSQGQKSLTGFRSGDLAGIFQSLMPAARWAAELAVKSQNFSEVFLKPYLTNQQPLHQFLQDRRGDKSCRLSLNRPNQKNS